MEQPVKMIYIAKEVYDSSQLKFLGKTTCAAVVGENGCTHTHLSYLVLCNRCYETVMLFP